jgi:hypothetical protein
VDELGHLHEHGVFLRRDALAMGYNDRYLRNACRDGAIVRIRHGAYVDAQTWASADESSRLSLRTHAAVMSHPSGFAASHVSAAALHGLRLWGSPMERSHLAKVDAVGGRRHHDVAYHDTLVGEVMSVAGTPVVGPAAAALGAAAISSVEAGMVAVDSAYSLGRCSPEDVRSVMNEMRQWPGTGRLQITLRLAEPGSESVGESRARYLFWQQHIPRPLLQFPIHDGSGLVGYSDFAWPDHGVLGEFDGRIKYGELLRPGETASDAVFREKLIEDRMREVTGWRFIRHTWADLARPAATANRLRQALRIR